MRSGRLSWEEGEDLARLDLAWTKRPSGHGPVLLAVEISKTVDSYDVERARERADLLARVAGEGWRVLPVVLGDAFAGDETAERAKAAGVAYYVRVKPPVISGDLERFVLAPPEPEPEAEPTR